MKIKEKELTRVLVEELGLDKLEVITSDMIDGYTIIGNYAFCGCTLLTSITLPNSITEIEVCAFKDCLNLTSITIPNSVTSIGYYAFKRCNSIASITIPNSVTSIGGFAFDICNNLKSVIIGNTTYETQEVVEGKCKAYKAFKADLTCLDFQYEEGKTYKIDGEPELCYRGFHACLKLLDVFDYYWGEIGKDIVIHEVELEGVSDEMNERDSKVVAKKITIGKRIL